VRVSICEGGELWIDDAVSLCDRPAVVLDAMRATAELDGPSIAIGLWQDPGQAGVVDVDTTRGVLAGFPVEVVCALSDKYACGRPRRARARACPARRVGGRRHRRVRWPPGRVARRRG